MRDIYAIGFEPVICLISLLKVFCVHTFIYQRLKKELANLARYLVFWADGYGEMERGCSFECSENKVVLPKLNGEWNGSTRNTQTR